MVEEILPYTGHWYYVNAQCQSHSHLEVVLPHYKLGMAPLKLFYAPYLSKHTVQSFVYYVPGEILDTTQSTVARVSDHQLKGNMNQP